MANASFYGSAQQHSSHVPPPQGQPQQPPYSAQQPPPPTGYQPNPFAQNQQAYAQQPLACYPPQPAYQQPYPPQSNYPPQAPQQHPAQQGYQSHHVQPAYQTPPTIGYAVDINSPQILHRNVTREIEAIREATKGWGSDKKALISILAKADPLHMASIRYHYGDRFHTDLKELIRKETKGHFQDALVSLIQGPLESDVRNLRQALEGIGTKEALLNDVLVGRTNADLQIIKAEYRRIFKRSLEEDVSNDLSLETKRMFAIILSANKADETTEVSGDQVNTDVLALRQATKGKLVGTDQMAVFDILCRRSNGQIRAIAFAYEQKYLRSLDKMISKACLHEMFWRTLADQS
ncbi:MAG: hypothetical protein M1814_005166 [Vezdaea aestivalis]|nr:MAG: hypothetical protein M1814_005166 [Vezdaea aestivalis]